MRVPLRFTGLLLPLALAVPVASCGSGDTAACSGAEHCTCYRNHTCDAGLSCYSNTCVDASSVGGDAGDVDQAAGAPGSGAARGDTKGEGGLANSQGDDTAGANSSGGDGSSVGAGGAGESCRTFQTYAEGTAPTVFVLVDRSGSMFNCLSTSTSNCADQNDTGWAALKAGTLEMIKSLEGSVRFGFGSFAGERTGTCPDFTRVDAAFDNYDKIAATYETITPPVKGETPTSQVLGSVKTILAADTSPGQKYVLLVTDGEPDFCDDGDPVCPVDASVGALQALDAAGIKTMVFGVDSSLSTISGATLQAFANAGAGLPVAPPTIAALTVKNQCQSSTGWSAAFTASGASGTSIGSYSTNGTATVFRPDPRDQAALTELFTTAVAGVKSCMFDLAAGLSVDLSKLARASVKIEGEVVARDEDNGWRMKTATQLELRGDACELWRDPASRSIDFNFPCGVVIGK